MKTKTTARTIQAIALQLVLTLSINPLLMAMQGNSGISNLKQSSIDQSIFTTHALLEPALSAQRYSIFTDAILAVSLSIISLIASASPAHSQVRPQMQLRTPPAPAPEIAGHVNLMRTLIDDLEKTYTVTNADRLTSLRQRAFFEAAIAYKVQWSFDQQALLYLLRYGNMSGKHSLEFLKILALHARALPQASESLVLPALMVYNSATIPAEKESARLELGIAVSLPGGLTVIKNLLESNDPAKQAQVQKAMDFLNHFGLQQYLHPSSGFLSMVQTQTITNPLTTLKLNAAIGERMQALQTIKGWPDVFMSQIESYPEGRAALIAQLLDSRTAPPALDILNRAISLQPLSMTPASEALLTEAMGQANRRGQSALADSILALREKMKASSSGKPVVLMQYLTNQPYVLGQKLTGAEANTDARPEFLDFWALWNSPLGERAVEGFRHLSADEKDLFAEGSSEAVLNIVNAFKKVLEAANQPARIFVLPKVGFLLHLQGWPSFRGISGTPVLHAIAYRAA